MAIISWLKGIFDGKKKAAEERRQIREIEDQLVFVKSDPLTLGVEFELALLDARTLKPAHEAAAIIAAANSPDIKKELFEHMVEVTTGICQDVHEAKAQLAANMGKVMAMADERGLLVSGGGRPPSLMLADCRRVQDKRYDYLQENRCVFNERFGTLGMHVHLGMESAEKCIRFHNFYMHFLPHLIALSGGSPFEEGRETGMASMRPTIAESMPISGMPYYYSTWQEYADLCRAVFRAGSIRSLKDLWWDARPCPRYGTLEIRICDQPTNLEEAMAIVAFVQLLGKWFEEHQSWLDEMPRPNAWRMRENKWRTMRYGLDAELVVNNQGDTRPVVEDMAQWLERLKPYIADMGYEDFADSLRAMLARGNSARRQRELFEQSHSAEAVGRHLAAELKAGYPLPVADAPPAANPAAMSASISPLRQAM